MSSHERGVRRQLNTVVGGAVGRGLVVDVLSEVSVTNEVGEEAGSEVALGTDDIADIYKPYSDGDMWTELRFLLEATHTYDMDVLADIATVNGRKALFLD